MFGKKLKDIRVKHHLTMDELANNLNQKFAYNMKLDVDLEGIYDGYTYRGKNASGTEYHFFKELNK